VLLVIPATAGAVHVFGDVDDANVHAPGIEWVAGSGVSVGCGDGTIYCPNDPVTRAQVRRYGYMVSSSQRLWVFLTGVDPSTSATVGVTVDDSTAFLIAAVNNQNLDGPGQNREQFITEYIFEMDAGDHDADLLASANSTTPFVSTNLNKLIVQALGVSCA